MHTQEEHRGAFSGSFGFLMTAIGSAIGVGNLWKFPYITGMNGGGVFVLVYLAIIFTIGVCVILGEMIIGRHTQLNPVGAYRAINKKTTFIGGIGVALAFAILTYYNIIGGWVLKYFLAYLTGQGHVIAQDSAAYFSNFIADPLEPILWALIFIALNLLVLTRKVTEGLEKANRFMMPILFVLLLIVAIRSCTLPGASAGLAFYLKPDFSKLSYNTFTAALAQVFFSLSLGEGIMITYGSYLDDQTDLGKMALSVPLLDTLAALIAGFAILPAVFAFGLNPDQGPGLIFVTLPLVFKSMPGGSIIGCLFFLLTLFAALSLFEVPISYLIDEHHWPRKKAALTMALLMAICCIPESLSNGIWTQTFFGMNFFDFISYLAESLFMPLCGFFMCIVLGYLWPMDEQFAEIEKNGHTFRAKGYYRFIIRYVAPLAILIIFLNSSGLISLFSR